VLSINLDGTFLGCKYAFPLLRKQAARSSTCRRFWLSQRQTNAYNALQGGRRAAHQIGRAQRARLPAARCAATPFARLSSMALMVDEIASGTRNPQAVHQRLMNDIPLGRLGQPGEVASLSFICCRMRPRLSPARIFQSMAG